MIFWIIAVPPSKLKQNEYKSENRKYKDHRTTSLMFFTKLFYFPIFSTFFSISRRALWD